MSPLATTTFGLVSLVASATSSGHCVPRSQARTLVLTRTGPATDTKSVRQKSWHPRCAKTRDSGFACAPKSYEVRLTFPGQCRPVRSESPWRKAPGPCHSLEWTFKGGAPARTPRPKMSCLGVPKARCRRSWPCRRSNPPTLGRRRGPWSVTLRPSS